MLKSVLTGLTVLDLTRARSGPTAVRQLADWGADVIKIEPAGETMYSDMGRRHAADFQNLHRNKRSLTLNLKNAEGKAIFMQLAAKADVIVENFRPRVKRSLGIDYPDVAKVNPRVVYGSISGFGQTGPYADRPGLDQVIQGIGGHMMVTGEAERGPMRSGAALSDMFAGILCASAIMKALWAREHTGEGQWVHTSLLEAQIFLLDFQVARWLVDKEVPTQEGNNHPMMAPMGAFETADGYVNIAPMPDMWQKLCQALGEPSLESDPRFARPADRRANRVALDAAINDITRRQPTAYWVERINAQNVPCGPIYKIAEMFDDPHLAQLGIVQTVTSQALNRELSLLGQPIHMSGGESRIALPAPEAGEHTDEILRDLGYDAEAIAGLRRQAII